jgi:hypothetical protein
MRLVRAGKWLLLLLALAWTWYAGSFFLFLANTFPVTQPVPNGTSHLPATAQGYALVFGPAIVAGLFLIMRWPEDKRSDPAERRS